MLNMDASNVRAPGKSTSSEALQSLGTLGDTR